MIIKAKYHCTKCKRNAYEYVGWEGGRYGSSRSKRCWQCKHNWILISKGNKL